MTDLLSTPRYAILKEEPGPYHFRSFILHTLDSALDHGAIRNLHLIIRRLPRIATVTLELPNGI